MPFSERRRPIVGLKVRGDRISELKALSILYKERKEKVEKRKDLEVDITRQNDSLIKLFVGILRPLCTRIGYGLHMAITDQNVEFSTEVGLKFKRGGSSARVSILQDKIDVWMMNEKNIKHQMRMLEKNMRLFKRLVGKDAQLRPANMVVVSIQTKNRYF